MSPVPGMDDPPPLPRWVDVDCAGAALGMLWMELGCAGAAAGVLCAGQLHGWWGWPLGLSMTIADVLHGRHMVD